MTGAIRAVGTQQLIAVIFVANIAVLFGAYGFETLGGLAPCQLCYYQRIPYFTAVILCAAAWFRPGLARAVSALLALNYMTGAGLGVYHAGVEWKWWQGPASCTVMDGADLTVEELMAQILAAPVVRCDEIPWSLFGISLAGYNALISAGLTGLSAYAFMPGRKDQNHGRI